MSLTISTVLFHRLQTVLFSLVVFQYLQTLWSYSLFADCMFTCFSLIPVGILHLFYVCLNGFRASHFSKRSLMDCFGFFFWCTFWLSHLLNCVQPRFDQVCDLHNRCNFIALVCLFPFDTNCVVFTGSIFELMCQSVPLTPGITV